MSTYQCRISDSPAKEENFSLFSTLPFSPPTRFDLSEFHATALDLGYYSIGSHCYGVEPGERHRQSRCRTNTDQTANPGHKNTNARATVGLAAPQQAHSEPLFISLSDLAGQLLSLLPLFSSSSSR